MKDNKVSYFITERRPGTVRIKKEKGMWYALFIALLPVLMMYRVPVIGLGVSTTMLIVCSFYAGFVVFDHLRCNGNRMLIAKIIVPFVIYLLYATFKSFGNITNAIQTLLVVVHIIAITTGAVNTQCLKRYICFIALLAATLVIIQNVLYYFLGFHLPCIIPNLCLKSLAFYRDWILTGIRDIEHLYRPSAFFLEPSHLTQYCFVALVFFLMHEKPQVKRAIWLSLGMAVTTSGMAIVLIAAVWSLFLLRVIQPLNWYRRIGILLIFMGAMIFAVVVLYQIPLFQSSLARILSPVEHSSKSYNAIWGRTLYWEQYISPLSGKELLLGRGYAELPEEYFTGLMELIYCSGIVGTLLYYVMFGMAAWNSKGVSRTIALMVCGLTLLANVTGFIIMTYYIGVIVSFALPENVDMVEGKEELHVA